jgi:hypothetical protein
MFVSDRKHSKKYYLTPIQWKRFPSIMNFHNNLNLVKYGYVIVCMTFLQFHFFKIIFRFLVTLHLQVISSKGCRPKVFFGKNLQC